MEAVANVCVVFQCLQTIGFKAQILWQGLVQILESDEFRYAKPFLITSSGSSDISPKTVFMQASEHIGQCFPLS